MRLTFRERMRGSFHLLSAPLEDRGAQLELEVSARPSRDALRAPALDAAGTIQLEGFASRRPCEGRVSLKIANEQRIPYDLHFTGDDGRPYQLFAQRDLSVPKLMDALTTLHASVCDESGAEVARAFLKMNGRAELGRLVRSIRVRLR
jgi:hypothetical protein